MNWFLSFSSCLISLDRNQIMEITRLTIISGYATLLQCSENCRSIVTFFGDSTAKSITRQDFESPIHWCRKTSSLHEISFGLSASRKMTE
jgi:hypothetical protein